MATGTFGIEKQHIIAGTASRQGRIVLMLFGSLAIYSVVYLLVLAAHFQV